MAIETDLSDFILRHLSDDALMYDDLHEEPFPAPAVNGIRNWVAKVERAYHVDEWEDACTTEPASVAEDPVCREARLLLHGCRARGTEVDEHHGPCGGHFRPEKENRRMDNRPRGMRVMRRSDKPPLPPPSRPDRRPVSRVGDLNTAGGHARVLMQAVLRSAGHNLHHCSDQALARYVQRTLRSHLLAWRRHINATSQAKHEVAWLHLTMSLMRRMWKLWVMLHETSKLEGTLALSHYRRTLLSQVMCKWRAEAKWTENMVGQAKILGRFRCASKAFAAMKRHAILNRTERQEQALVQQLQADKKQHEKAVRHHERSLLSCSFVLWSRAGAVAREERRYKEQHEQRRKRIGTLVSTLSSAADSGVSISVEETPNSGQAIMDAREEPRQPTQSHVRVRPLAILELAPATVDTGQRGAHSRRSSGSVRDLMEQRAMERAARREAFKLKQETLERERKLEKQRREQYAELKAIQELERLREQKREQRMKEEQKHLERAKEVERAREALHLSRMHYRRANLIYRGVLPWRKLREQARLHETKATALHNDHLVQRTLRGWKRAVREAIREREKRQLLKEHNAAMRYHRALCRRILSALASRCAVTAAKGQAVQLRSRLVASRGLLACWRRTWLAQNERVARRMLKAAHMECQLTKRRVIRTWAAMTEQWREEKELDVRKTSAWARVRDWLDD